MLAAVFYGANDLRMDDVPDPEPGEGEVVVQLEAALTCGTDVKALRRGAHPMFSSLPAGFGHEFAGRVAASRDRRFPEGTRVAVGNSAPCGRCFYCRKRRPSLCEQLRFLVGAFAERVLVPAHIVGCNVYPLPDALPAATAAMLEPLGCAAHAIEECQLQVGDCVVVLGAGPLGLMLVRLAALAGAQVIACDRSPARLEAARRLGAVAALDYSAQPDQAAAVRHLTPEGYGADVVIEAVGRQEVWELAPRMARNGGLVMLFGGCPLGSAVSLDTAAIHYGELTLKGVFHHTPRHLRQALDLLSARQVTADPFISGTFPLAQTLEALEAMERRRGIKFAIVP